MYASPGVPTLAMIDSIFGTGTPNWVESLTLKAPRSACASTFRRLMKLSKSDDARTGENKKMDKNMMETKENIFFMTEPHPCWLLFLPPTALHSKIIRSVYDYGSLVLPDRYYRGQRFQTSCHPTFYVLYPLLEVSLEAVGVVTLSVVGVAVSGVAEPAVDVVAVVVV